MPVETQKQIEHVPLSKQRLLEFIEGQDGPVTAKAASIDLDSRASTVTEMLERCAAQGLVEREANQRPREYQITDSGRRRLELLRISQGESAEGPDSEPEPAEPVQTGEVQHSGSKRARLQQMLDRLRDAMTVSPEEQSTTRQEQSSEPEQADAEEEDILPWDDPKVQRLYGLEMGLSDLPRRIVRDERDSLAQVVGQEVADQVAKLVRCVVARDACDCWWDGKSAEEKLEREIAGLRDKLGCTVEGESEAESAESE